MLSIIVKTYCQLKFSMHACHSRVGGVLENLVETVLVVHEAALWTKRFGQKVVHYERIKALTWELIRTWILLYGFPCKRFIMKMVWIWVLLYGFPCKHFIMKVVCSSVCIPLQTSHNKFSLLCCPAGARIWLPNELHFFHDTCSYTADLVSHQFLCNTHQPACENLSAGNCNQYSIYL